MINSTHDAGAPLSPCCCCCSACRFCLMLLFQSHGLAIADLVFRRDNLYPAPPRGWYITSLDLRCSAPRLATRRIESRQLLYIRASETLGHFDEHHQTSKRTSPNLRPLGASHSSSSRFRAPCRRRRRRCRRRFCDGFISVPEPDLSPARVPRHVQVLRDRGALGQRGGSGGSGAAGGDVRGFTHGGAPGA